MLLFCKRLQLKPRLHPLAPACRTFLPSLVGLPNFGLRSHKFGGKSRSKDRGHLFQLNEASAAHKWKKSGRESRLESQKQVVAFCEQGTFPNSHIIIKKSHNSRQTFQRNKNIVRQICSWKACACMLLLFMPSLFG